VILKKKFNDEGKYGNIITLKKVKLSRYTPWWYMRHMGGEEVQLLLILNIGSRWG
jgi:hypothetical protein